MWDHVIIIICKNIPVSIIDRVGCGLFIEVNAFLFIVANDYIKKRSFKIA